MPPTAYETPPREQVEDGALRRVGVELEFSGLALADAARLVSEAFDGAVEPISAYEHRVECGSLGAFNVELDFEYLKARGREDREFAGGIVGELDQLSEEAIARVAWQIVPLEVVSPPIPIDRLAEFDRLIASLREAGAKGTGHATLYAFGMHLNPEMPALDAHTVLAYAQSYLCLHDWLVRRERVDLARRLTPYINPFPREYVELAIAPDYAPDIDRFADDYLVWNADRNRALDLLPLLAHLDEARVREAVDDPRIKSRPALHYRLPNCEVDVEGWGVHAPWSHWLAVERFAADDAARAELCAAYSEHLGLGLGALLDPWWKRCETLVDALDR